MYSLLSSPIYNLKSISVSHSEEIFLSSGIIGKSWAMLFASVACKVVIYDIKPKQIEAALTDIKQQLQRLEQESILRGTLNASEQFDKISGMIKIRKTLESYCC